MQAKIPRLSRVAFILEKPRFRFGIAAEAKPLCPAHKSGRGAQTVGMFKRFVTMALTAVCLAAALMLVMYFTNDPPAPRVGNFMTATCIGNTDTPEKPPIPRPEPRNC